MPPRTPPSALAARPGAIVRLTLRVAAAVGPGSAPPALSTATDSPVSAASSTRNATPLMSTASAGTRSPCRSTTRSPGTSSATGRLTSWPPRTVRATGATSSSSARTARSAFSSWRTPSVVLTSTTRAMTRVSVRSWVAIVSTIAARSTRTRGSRTARSTRRQRGIGCAAGRLFGPKRRSRSAASSGLRPAASRAVCRSDGVPALTGAGGSHEGAHGDVDLPVRRGGAVRSVPDVPGRRARELRADQARRAGRPQ